MEEELHILLQSLSWDLSEDEQEKGIQKLIPYKDYIINSLITNTSKHQWKNAVRLVEKLEYPYRVRMVPQLLLLLKDMNWPGAIDAGNIIKNLKPEEIIAYIRHALIQADNENDTVWIAWINELIEEMNIKEQLKDIENIILKADW